MGWNYLLKGWNYLPQEWQLGVDLFTVRVELSVMGWNYLLKGWNYLPQGWKLGVELFTVRVELSVARVGIWGGIIHRRGGIFNYTGVEMV